MRDLLKNQGRKNILPFSSQGVINFRDPFLSQGIKSRRLWGLWVLSEFGNFFFNWGFFGISACFTRINRTNYVPLCSNWQRTLKVLSKESAPVLESLFREAFHWIETVFMESMTNWVQNGYYLKLFQKKVRPLSSLFFWAALHDRVQIWHIIF